MAWQTEEKHKRTEPLQPPIADENRQGKGVVTKGTSAVHSKARRVVHFLWDWLTAAIAGVSALGLMRVIAPWLGFTVKINLSSLMLAACLGAPGVVLLLFLRLFFWHAL